MHTPLLRSLLAAAVMQALFAPASRAQEPKNLLTSDIAAAPAFDIKKQGDKNLPGASGEFSPPWSGNLWDADSRGEFVLSATPVAGSRAVGLRNLSGKGSAQFYMWQPLGLPAGRRYAVACSYLTQGGASGGLKATGEKIRETSVLLPDTAGRWKTAQMFVAAPEAGANLGLNFQNFATGPGNGLFVRSVSVTESGAVPAGAAPARPNATSPLPDLKLSDVADPLNRSVIAEVQALHPKRLLWAPDPDAGLSRFQRNSVEGRAAFADVAVTGMPFKEAIRVDTDKKPQEWQTHLQSFTAEPIHGGDVLYLSAWVRLIRRTDGQAAGQGRLYASHDDGGGQQSSPLGQADFAIPPRWTRIHIPLAADRDYGAGDRMKLMWTFGFTGQVVEIGGITVLDFGPGVARERLPHTPLDLDYAGRAPNAAWRKAALARIEKYRKGGLKVIVTDAKGRPVPNAAVKVVMTRHAFLFGASTPVGMLPGQNVKPWNADFARTAGASDADKKKLQETFLRLFNATTASVTWAVWSGADVRISRDDILAGLQWFKQNHIPVLNSQVVYPGPEFTDPAVAKTVMNKEHAPEFGRSVDGFIREQLSPPLGDYLASVQIANEIEGRPQYTDILGRDAVAHWFEVARQANPKIGREINGPYSLGQSSVQTHNRGAAWPTGEGLQYYYDLIAYLRRRNAPVQYVGFQNHGGLGMPGPNAVLKSLDQFGALGLPLEVTEFEIALQNGSDPAQRRYQADYVRDYLTAVFSHPSVRALILQDFWQPGAWQAGGASAFFNADWSANPHEKVYEDLVLGKWWTRTGGRTGKGGSFAARGFLGDYDVTVTAGGRTKTVKMSLPKGGRALRVQLQ